MVNISNTLADAIDTATQAAMIAALRVLNVVPSKDKLEDSKDKALYVRCVRIVHNGAETIDRSSYRNMSEVENKSKAYREAKRLASVGGTSTAPKA